MHVIILQQESFENAGNIIDWIKENNFVSTTYHTYNNEFPDLNDHAGLIIVMGGASSVAEIEKHPFLGNVAEYLKRKYIAGVKILGICLGAQLLAYILNARVYKNIQKEIGWYPVIFNNKELTTEGFQFFPDKLMVFHWHGDTFDIPVGSLPIGSSDITPNQGFVYNNQVYALQFHLETTQDTMAQIAEHLPGAGEQGELVQCDNQILSLSGKYVKDCNRLMIYLLNHIIAR